MELRRLILVMAVASPSSGFIAAAEALPESRAIARAKADPPPRYVDAHAYFHAMRAERLKLSGDREGAIEAFELALVYDPDSYDLHVVLAELLIGQGEDTGASRGLGAPDPSTASRASKLIDHALLLGPDRAPAWQLLSRLHRLRGEQEEAERALRRGIGVRPGSPEGVRAGIELAELLSRQGRLPEAAHLLERAIKLAPKDPEPLIALALLETERGHRELALGWLEKRGGASLRTTLVRSVLLERSGRAVEAAALWSPRVLERPSDPRVLAEAMRAELRAGRDDRAEAYLRMILDAAPAWSARAAAILIEEDRSRRALALLADHRPLPPEISPVELLEVEATRLAQSGGLEQARTELEARISSASVLERPRLLSALGAIEAAGPELDRAEAAYKDALGLDPSLVRARAGLAEVLERRGRAEEARAMLALALAFADTQEVKERLAALGARPAELSPEPSQSPRPRPSHAERARLRARWASLEASSAATNTAPLLRKQGKIAGRPRSDRRAR